MKWSQALIPTLKETPSEAEVISHKLMLRAGLIRKLCAGAYTYLPLGFKVLKKIESIIREEIDATGAQEMLMPAIQPPDLWRKSKRYAELGADMIKYKDRTGREMLLGPTHEEVVTDIARCEIRSYKDMPKILYQIQTKFRDEARPRFGVVRSKEFIMKDAYSFDVDEAALGKSYDKMYKAYCKIFKRCGLDYIVVKADPGMMGGKESAEFMVLTEAGEDIIAVCSCGFAASLDMAECSSNQKADISSHGAESQIQEVETPGVTTVEKVSKLLGVKPQQLIKTLIYLADDKPIAALVRGDHDLNEAKLTKYLKCAKLTLADSSTITRLTAAPVGFSGPVGLKGIRIIADEAIKGIVCGITGANKKDKHFINVCEGRDFKVQDYLDLRIITSGDPCPKCKKKKISLERAIEMGHVFKLGTKYTKALGANFLDKTGKEHPIIMGCYGIGVTRIIAAVIEKHNDNNGIIWPKSISPYDVIIIPLNMADKKIDSTAKSIYTQLQDKNINCLLDDRNISAGIKFKDADLIGIPLQVVIGPNSIKKNKLEIKQRGKEAKKEVKISEAVKLISSHL